MTKVYVQNMRGKPLMPTTPAKARQLLKQKKAKVVKRTPFTIQLTYSTGETVQKITLGVDAGSKHIGLSASTEQQELYAADAILRTDVSKNIEARAMYRRARRGRKTRYRKARFLNRVSSKKKGWLAPSVKQKVDSHLTMVDKVSQILPIDKIVVETAAFDTQKIANPDIKGKEYSQGVTLGFANVREYVLYRDKHTCQCCKGKKKDSILQVHHVIYRSKGGTDKPSNLITLCKSCHTPKAHKEGGILHDWMMNGGKKVKRQLDLRDAAFMSIMRWGFYDRLKELYGNDNVGMTYGYITKHTRIGLGLEKSHHADAHCITGNILAKRSGNYFAYKKVRCQNRQIHKATINKGGTRKLNQCPHEVNGFRLFDKVKWQGRELFVYARRRSGSFSIRTLDGEVVKAGITWRKLELVSRSSGWMVEGRSEK